DATNYLCTILPENAGNVTVTNNDVQISWNTNYTGNATVSVAAVNLCGNSDWSSAEVLLKNTLGLNEISNIAFSIFPNPANGKIRLQINNNTNEVCTFSIINMLGETVYSETFTENRANFSHETDLSFLSNGVYKVVLNNSETRIVKNLVIKH
ncbi:MAG: T9SS type A sorting domain-containing protein, partial [Bacteroidales bacterium]